MNKYEKEEKELEDLLLRAEDLSGWCHWNSNKDPRKQVFKNFLRFAIEPLKQKIADLENENLNLKEEIRNNFKKD